MARRPGSPLKGWSLVALQAAAYGCGSAPASDRLPLSTGRETRHHDVVQDGTSHARAGRVKVDDRMWTAPAPTSVGEEALSSAG